MDPPNIAEETTPLLPIHNAEQNALKKPTPLPRTQLAILCTIRLMDPLTFTQVRILFLLIRTIVITSRLDISVHQSISHLTQPRLIRVANRLLQWSRCMFCSRPEIRPF